MGKMLDEAELAQIVAQRQATGERAVFTNGVFDLLHVGHARYLKRSRALGDFLIVGVNSDASTRRLKGPERPINPAAERAKLLAALACVDYITIFGDPTASRLVELLRPAVYAKGGDYNSNDPQSRESDIVLMGDELGMCSGEVGTHLELAGVSQRLPEACVVARYGGSIALLAYLPQHSTTALIQRIQSGGSQS